MKNEHDARARFAQWHRLARKGCLGSLATGTATDVYRWLLAEVFAMRFPRIGSDRHSLNGVRSFDRLAGGFRSRHWLRLANGRRTAA